MDRAKLKELFEEFRRVSREFDKRVRRVVDENFERVRDELFKESCKPEDYPAVKEHFSRYLSKEKLLDEVLTCITDVLWMLATNGCTPSPDFDFRLSPEFKGVDPEELIIVETYCELMTSKLLELVAKELGIRVEVGVCIRVSEEDRKKLARIAGYDKLDRLLKSLFDQTNSQLRAKSPEQ